MITGRQQVDPAAALFVLYRWWEWKLGMAKLNYTLSCTDKAEKGTC